MTTRSRGSAALVLLVLLVGSVACGDGAQDAPPGAAPASVEGLDGGRIRLADPDAVTVVAFVASWCVPCRVELPALQERFAAAAPGVRYVAVAVQEEPAATRRLVEETGIGFEVGRDPDGIALAGYGFLGLPGTLILDRDGAVSHRYRGTIDFDDLDRRVAALSAG